MRNECILAVCLVAGSSSVVKAAAVALQGQGGLQLDAFAYADADPSPRGYASDGRTGPILRDFSGSVAANQTSGPRDFQGVLLATQAQSGGSASESLTFVYQDAAKATLDQIRFSASANLSASIDNSIVSPYPTAFSQLNAMVPITFNVTGEALQVHLSGEITGNSSRVDHVTDKQVYLAQVNSDGSLSDLFLQIDPGTFDQTLTLPAGNSYYFAAGLNMQSQAGEYQDYNNTTVLNAADIEVADVQATLTFGAVPEPGTIALLGAVVTMALGRRDRKADA